MFLKEYIGTVTGAVKSLLKGMRLTGYYFIHPAEIITQQYPENRALLNLPERFRGEVIMPHNENNEHRCNGCQSCEIACPNGTIKIINKQEVQADGKKKKRLHTFVYNLSMCTFCNLCVDVCPSNAIKMGQGFEHSVFDRNKLIKILNNPDSKIMEGVE